MLLIFSLLEKGSADHTPLELRRGSADPQLPIAVPRESKNFLKRIWKSNDKKRSLSGSSDGRFDRNFFFTIFQFYVAGMIFFTVYCIYLHLLNR